MVKRAAQEAARQAGQAVSRVTESCKLTQTSHVLKARIRMALARALCP